jgi:hypothetical protein
VDKPPVEMATVVELAKAAIAGAVGDERSVSSVGSSVGNNGHASGSVHHDTAGRRYLFPRDGSPPHYLEGGTLVSRHMMRLYERELFDQRLADQRAAQRVRENNVRDVGELAIAGTVDYAERGNHGVWITFRSVDDDDLTEGWRESLWPDRYQLSRLGVLTKQMGVIAGARLELKFDDGTTRAVTLTGAVARAQSRRGTYAVNVLVEGLPSSGGLYTGPRNFTVVQVALNGEQR